MTGKDLLISWLNDAHGMENALIKILEHQVKDARDYPPVQAKLEQHLEQTRGHAQMTKDCIEALGGHTSALKTGLATLFGQLQAPSTGPAKDEMVKNALADYAAENFEIASYTALIQAAQDLGEQQTARGVSADSAGGTGNGPLDTAESAHVGPANLATDNRIVYCFNNAILLANPLCRLLSACGASQTIIESMLGGLQPPNILSITRRAAQRQAGKICLEIALSGQKDFLIQKGYSLAFKAPVF